MRTLLLSDLTDSRILYTRRPPLFGYMIIGLTLAAIAGALVWASATIKPSVVQGSGTVEGSNRTLIMSSVSGPIREVVTPNGGTAEAGAPLIVVDSPELTVERQTLSAQKASLETSLALQQRFTSAVDAGDNEFNADSPDEALYFYQYESLEAQKSQLDVDRPSLEAIGYTPVEIDNVIETNELKEEEIETTALSTSTERERELRRQIDEVNIRLAAVDTGGQAFTVKAAQAGTVYLNDRVKPGTVLTAGEPIGSIASADDGLSITVLLSVPDRQYVDVGDPVHISVTGLPNVEYGDIPGVVSSIDNDVTSVTGIQSASGSANFFVADVAISRDYVETRDGERHRLVNGTAVEAEFVYEEITYLEHFAQLIGIA